MISIKTKKPIALLTDLHFGLSRNSEVKRNILVNFIDDFIKNNKKTSDTLFFLGDWFHSRTLLDVHTINIAYSCMKKLCKHFNVYAITGNHDIYLANNTTINSIKPFSDIDNLTVVSVAEEVEIEGTLVKTAIFCPWNTDVGAITKKYDYSFSHLHVGGIVYHGETSNHLQLDDFLSKAGISFLGHFHHNKEVTTRTGRLVCIGSQYQQTFGERDNNCGYYLLDTNKETITFVENKKSPRYVKCYASTIDQIDKKSITGNFTRIVFDKKLSYSEIVSITNTINKLNPLELSIDYMVSAQHNVLGEEVLENVNKKLSLSKLEYMKKFLDGMTSIKPKVKEATFELLQEYYQKTDLL